MGGNEKLLLASIQQAFANRHNFDTCGELRQYLVRDMGLGEFMSRVSDGDLATGLTRHAMGVVPPEVPSAPPPRAAGTYLTPSSSDRLSEAGFLSTGDGDARPEPLRPTFDEGVYPPTIT